MPSLLSPVNVTWINVLTALPLALIFGLFIAFIYRRVMTNLSYSVPILHTIVYLAMIVALIMIIVANELVRALHAAWGLRRDRSSVWSVWESPRSAGCSSCQHLPPAW